VWQDGRWTVQGRQSVWLLTREGREEFGPGSVVDVPGPVLGQDASEAAS